MGGFHVSFGRAQKQKPATEVTKSFRISQISTLKTELQFEDRVLQLLAFSQPHSVVFQCVSIFPFFHSVSFSFQTPTFKTKLLLFGLEGGIGVEEGVCKLEFLLGVGVQARVSGDR